MRRRPGRRSQFLRSCPRRPYEWARLPLSAVLALSGTVPWLGPALAAIVIAGLAAGLVSPVRATDALAASLALTSLALVASRPHVVRTVALVAVGAVMVAYGARARDRALVSPLDEWFAARAPGARMDEPVAMRARLLDDAQNTEFGVRLRAAVLAVLEDGEWRPTRGTAQIHVAGQAAAEGREEWTAGRLVEAPVLLRAPPVLLNPGGASERWQRLQRPFDLAGTVKSAALVAVERGAWWQEGGAAARR
ncbi:MAG TPA: DUF4131 domain-containing protein, partial [Vicinamibacterales bacterium]|nr:DUF4131 domain-containing protein [Vicinamibacterales bacterium]